MNGHNIKVILQCTGSDASYAIRRPRFQVLPDENYSNDTTKNAESRDMISSMKDFT